MSSRAHGLPPTVRMMEPACSSAGASCAPPGCSSSCTITSGGGGGSPGRRRRRQRGVAGRWKQMRAARLREAVRAVMRARKARGMLNGSGPFSSMPPSRTFPKLQNRRYPPPPSTACHQPHLLLPEPKGLELAEGPGGQQLASGLGATSGAARGGGGGAGQGARLCLPCSSITCGKRVAVTIPRHGQPAVAGSTPRPWHGSWRRSSWVTRGAQIPPNREGRCPGALTHPLGALARSESLAAMAWSELAPAGCC